MKFSAQHIVFNTMHIFTDENPPDVFIDKKLNWYFKDYILKLKVGDKIESNYWLVKRLE